jgi:ABC-type dipeptide/oligopeptide/nickel transport system ATPase component
MLRVTDLGVSFDNGRGPRLQAVDGVRMSVFPRQTLAVVGESGCGKSVTAMSLMHLVPRPPGRFDRGRAVFASSRGEVELLGLSEREIRRVRGGEIAMIFQEPMTSLNPVFTVRDQIVEAVLLHQDVREREAEAIAARALADVGIADPERRLKGYPHQFSGGMRQRVMIAMALACRPRLLLADEPTTALDVTVQAQILGLLGDMKRSRGMGVMLITHDLGVVAEHADVVCVMYAGRVVEYARVGPLFERPLHPYTRGLLASIPKLGEARERLVTIAEVIDHPESFRTLAGGLRPWWPWHERPAGVAGGDEYALVEAEPERWVGVWKTGAVGDGAREPVIEP